MTNAVLDAIENRRTTNIYDRSRNISDEQIGELVRLATRALTALHLQNWRFMAVKTPEAKARLRKLVFDQSKVTAAAVTFIVVGQLASHLLLAERRRQAGFWSAEALFSPIRNGLLWSQRRRRMASSSRTSAASCWRQPCFLP